MNTIEELAEWFSKNKIECRIYCWPVSNWKWAIHCEKADDGIKVEVNTSHKELYIALYDAYEKFQTTAFRGAGNLLAPVIEHKPMTLEEHETKQEKALNDDIPF